MFSKFECLPTPVSDLRPCTPLDTLALSRVAESEQAFFRVVSGDDTGGGTFDGGLVPACPKECLRTAVQAAKASARANFEPVRDRQRARMNLTEGESFALPCVTLNRS